MRNGLWSVIGGLLSATVPARSGEQPGGVQSRTAQIGTDSYDYQVYIPGKLHDVGHAPVIVFLHGIGQRGTGGFVPVEGTTGALVRRYLNQVPAIILLPQCRQGSYWTEPRMEQMVMKALEQTVAEFGVDPNRLYLTGVSMGGYGVWHLAAQHPGKFAALVSVCGGSPLQNGDRFSPIAQKVGRTPAWLFHGSDDKVVPVSESRELVRALKAVGADVKYSEYAGVGHNVWLKVVAEKELMTWLLAASRTTVQSENYDVG